MRQAAPAPSSDASKKHSYPRPRLPKGLLGIRRESRASMGKRREQREIRQAADRCLQDIRKAAEKRGWPCLLEKANADASAGKISMPVRLIENFRDEGILFFSDSAAGGAKYGGKVAILYTRTHDALLGALSEAEQVQLARNVVRGNSALPSRGQISVHQTFEEATRAIMHVHMDGLSRQETLELRVIGPLRDIGFELAYRGGDRSELLAGLQDTYAGILHTIENLRNFLSVQGKSELEDNMHLMDTGNTPALGAVVFAAGSRFEARVESINPAIAKAERRLRLVEQHICAKLSRNPNSGRMRSNLLALKMWKVWHALHELKVQFRGCYSEQRARFLQAHKAEVFKILDDLLRNRDRALIGNLLEHWHFFSSIDLVEIARQSRSEKPDLLKISRHVQSSAAMLEQGAIFRGYLSEPALGWAARKANGPARQLTWDIGNVMRSLPGIFGASDEKFGIVPRLKTALNALFEFIFQPEIEKARQRMLNSETGPKFGASMEEYKRAFLEQPKYDMIAKAIGKVQILAGQFRAEEAATLRNQSPLHSDGNGTI